MLRKIENCLFYLFLFAIPISVRHIFAYQPFNFIEWTAVYVYATDILFGFLLIFYFLERGRNHKANVRRRVAETERKTQLSFDAFRRWLRASDWFLLAFVVVAGLSIRNAMDVHTAVFAWVKLIEGVMLYFYVKDYALKRFKLSKGFVAIVLGAAFQAVIAIAQFMIQGSLGLKYLGESVLAPALSGIAAFYVHGIKIMRAYGTTPHSNVLAVYLFVALGAFYSIAIYQKRQWWWHVLHAIILWAFLLTFSRVVIGMWILDIVVLMLATYALCPRPLKPVPSISSWSQATMSLLPLLDPRVQVVNIKRIFWTTLAVCTLFAICYWPYILNRSEVSTTDEAVQLRLLYNHESLASTHHVLGLGMGNFVPWLMTQNLHLDHGLYQPVHNIYLLIYSEVGISGVALFILFLAFLLYDFYRRTGFKKLYHFYFGLIFISVLVMGLFDHYFWTIQSGRLIFWLVLGLLAGVE